MKLSSLMNSGHYSNESKLKSCGSLDSNMQRKPICRCGDIAVLRRASTVTNFGKQFWGRCHYKGATQAGCRYFDWFYEYVVDKKDQFTKKQKIRLEKLKNELDVAKMELEYLRATNDGLKIQLRELQIQMKKMVNHRMFHAG